MGRRRLVTGARRLGGRRERRGDAKRRASHEDFNGPNTRCLVVVGAGVVGNTGHPFRPAWRNWTHCRCVGEYRRLVVVNVGILCYCVASIRERVQGKWASLFARCLALVQIPLAFSSRALALLVIIISPCARRRSGRSIAHNLNHHYLGLSPASIT